MRRRNMYLLSLLLLMTMFIISCGNQENTSNDPAPSEPTQTEPANETEEPAANESREEREQRLLEAAKANNEKTFVLYSSMPQADSKILTDKFTEKYGVEIEVWRASAENITQRYMEEAIAGRFDADVIESGATDFELFIKDGLLQKIESPYLTEYLDEEYLQEHKMYFPVRMTAFVMAYNTNLVSEDELPKTYEDLLDPKWKGRLGIEAGDQQWFMEVVENLGKEKGIQFFKDLVATNGLTVRKGHSLLAELVSTGEVPMALTVYDYKIRDMAKKGAPIKMLTIPPVITTVNSTAMSKNTDSPNLAKLYIDFVLNEGMQIINDIGYGVLSNNVTNSLAEEMKDIKIIDPIKVVNEWEEWDGLWQEIIINQK